MNEFREDAYKGTSMVLKGGYTVQAERLGTQDVVVTITTPAGNRIVMGEDYARLIADSIPKALDALE